MSDIQISFQDLTLGEKAAKLVSFVGQLDETNVDHEAKQIYQVITEMAEPVLLLDFTSLEYMNSKSIGYVTDWFTQASAKNGSISIIGPKPNILDILKVVGITQIINVYDSLEAARTAISGVTSPVDTQSTAPAVPTPATPVVPVAEAPSSAPAVPAPATPVVPVAEAPSAADVPPVIGQVPIAK